MQIATTLVVVNVTNLTMILLPTIRGVSQKRKGGLTELTRASKAHRGPPAKPAIQTRRAVNLVHRDRLVLEHQWLVRGIAIVILEKLPVHMDLDDLIQAGLIGLIDAANKFDPSQQAVFTCYARHRIKGAMLDSLRQLDWASRGVRQRQRKVEVAKRDLIETLQRVPIEAEVAGRLGMDLSRYRRMTLDLQNGGPISADSGANQGENPPALDFPGKPETQPDFICIRNELRKILGKAVKILPDRYQEVLTLYYTQELSMAKIGGRLGINESRVSQIHKSALERIALLLHHQGIHSIQAFQGGVSLRGLTARRA
jgi:RNA polymerase sigma factor for flagellar operon FliA